MLKEDISKTLALVERAIQWGDKYEPGTFPKEQYKVYRRELKKIRYALDENCSAAAYGESQVGKSYLIGSLLASSSKPLTVTDGTRNYNFVNEVNPSGGATAKKESTGVITRFSLNNDNPAMSAYVKIKTLSIADIILLLSDSYYKDVNRDLDSNLTTASINQSLQEFLNRCANKNATQSTLTEDDVYEVQDYFKDILKVSDVLASDFFKKVPQAISHIGQEHWAELFALLWNGNENLSGMFGKIIAQFSRIGFKPVIYVPFDTLLKDHGSLLKISWLDSICSMEAELPTDIPESDIFSPDGTLIASGFPKSYLSLLTAEVNFFLPEEVKEERPFLAKVDLLDFPGARRRENIEEKDVQKQLPEIIRRGKVAYLFNKYSRSLKLNALMFCKDQDMNGDSTIGASLGFWIDEMIGDTHEKRTSYLKETHGVSPFMIVATKFNTELKWTNERADKKEILDEKWNTRFERNLLEEVIHPKTSPWFDKWADGKPFRSIYPLRDFFWSRDQHIFSGYVEGVSEETAEIIPADYPTYRQDLKASFVKHPFIQKYFDNPSESWDSFATIGNDGTKPIIDTLCRLSGHLDDARLKHYSRKFDAIVEKILAELTTHFISDNVNERIEQARQVSGEVKLSLEMSFGLDPSVFGRITKQYMMQSEELHEIVYDLVVRQVETPRDFSLINVVRMNAGIDPSKPRTANIEKMMARYNMTEDKLAEYFGMQGVSLDDVVSGDSEICATWSDLITKKITEAWMEHMGSAAAQTSGSLMHSNSISSMYKLMFGKLKLKDVIHEKIEGYMDSYDSDMLPTVIADSVSFILDNFISNVGWEYMTDAEKAEARRIAGQCGIELDFSHTSAPKEQRPLLEVLDAFDKSTDLLRGRKSGVTDDTILRHLPLWDNFKRWENLLIIGLIYTSDIVDCNPEANAAIGRIIADCNTIKA